MYKLPHNCTHLTYSKIHLTYRKIMLKILQARLQSYINQELPDVQAGFTKVRGTRDPTANIHWTTEKAKDPEIKLPSKFLTVAS